MTDIDSRYIAFENDHTYLKTNGNGEEGVQLLQTSISQVGPKSDVLSTILSTTKQQNIVDINKIVPTTVNMLKVPCSNIFFLPNSLNFPFPSNIKIIQNNLAVKKVIVGNKLSIKQIQSKVIDTTKTFSARETQSNVLPIKSTNTSKTKCQNITQKKMSVKPKLPVETKEKPVIKPIEPMKNQIVKDNENGVCTIKLSSDLIKRIQSGEKLFMCVECDEIYTEHKDLLKHQKSHDKFSKQLIVTKKEREQIVSNNVKEKKVINEDKNVVKQTKHIFRSSVNPKKRKVIFQGECIMCHSVFQDLGKHISTVHQNDLNKNIKNIVNNLNYRCYKCDMEFDIKQQLRAHELSAHQHTYSYSCEHCFKEFAYSEDLETHIEIHHSDSIKYLCPYCDAGFPRSNGLRTHLVKHTDFNSSDKCNSEIPACKIEYSPTRPHTSFNSYENCTSEIPVCKIEYSPTRPPEQFDQLFAELDNISEEAEVYIEQVADDNYQVKFANNNEDSTSSPLSSLIDENYKTDTELNKVQLEDNNKTFINQQQTTSVKKRVSYTVCRICLSIVSYSRIGGHMKKKHNNAAPYQCEICHADFSRKHIMDDHRRKHTNDKPHKCVECSKCFTYKHHLSRHMMLVHKADSLEKPFKCSVCDKAFSFKEYLTLHINSRHKGKHYMCQICGKNFSTNATLNKHQLCHTDERPFMCEHCGRTFKCKTHCDTHTKNMHPGDPLLDLPPEKFECNLCGKKFSTKVYRDMHFKRHNGQGHQCDICYKLFVSKAHKLRHIKIMHRN